MRHAATRLFALSVSSLLISCASVPRYVDPAARASPRHYVHVWVQPGLSADDAHAGCELWREKGVACVIVHDRDYADITVEADRRPCVAHDDGLRTLAEAYRGGRIVFYTSCFMDDGTFDRQEFRTVMGHEVGHEVGIWEHVPLECGADAPRHPDGHPICGRALMNPLYDKDVAYMTPVDSLAFDVRDPEISVLVADKADIPPPSDRPDCVYRAR
uniref:Lipoprotein n=1 Tax=uncultured bacterium pA1 TaxID=1776268 RepID=A0A0U3B8M8_9BACT|nr:hypothetical protein [uncultured bacterium pA1]